MDEPKTSSFLQFPRYSHKWNVLRTSDHCGIAEICFRKKVLPKYFGRSRSPQLCLRKAAARIPGWSGHWRPIDGQSKTTYYRNSGCREYITIIHYNYLNHCGNIALYLSRALGLAGPLHWHNSYQGVKSPRPFPVSPSSNEGNRRSESTWIGTSEGIASLSDASYGIRNAQGNRVNAFGEILSEDDILEEDTYQHLTSVIQSPIQQSFIDRYLSAYYSSIG